MSRLELHQPLLVHWKLLAHGAVGAAIYKESAQRSHDVVWKPCAMLPSMLPHPPCCCITKNCQIKSATIP
eukprot:1803775-Rhodomonas_salina.1